MRFKKEGITEKCTLALAATARAPDPQIIRTNGLSRGTGVSGVHAIFSNTLPSLLLFISAITSMSFFTNAVDIFTERLSQDPKAPLRPFCEFLLTEIK